MVYHILFYVCFSPLTGPTYAVHTDLYFFFTNDVTRVMSDWKLIGHSQGALFFIFFIDVEISRLMLVEVQTKPAECQKETLSVGNAHYLRDILTILFPVAQPLPPCEYLSEKYSIFLYSLRAWFWDSNTLS